MLKEGICPRCWETLGSEELSLENSEVLGSCDLLVSERGYVYSSLDCAVLYSAQEVMYLQCSDISAPEAKTAPQPQVGITYPVYSTVVRCKDQDVRLALDRRDSLAPCSIELANQWTYQNVGPALLIQQKDVPIPSRHYSGVVQMEERENET